MNPAIRTLDLTKSFGGASVVDSLTLEVGEGELFGLVGPDGAGKTTVMRLLAAIMRPTGGDAWIAGKSVRGEPEAVKNVIGYVSQRFGLYRDLSVGENIDFYADIYGVSRAARRGRVERLLEFSGLAPFKRRLAGALSGGMKQKLGLVCALVHTPKVLLLDEPTNGVDPVSRRDLWRILYDLLGEGVTIFVSTAYLDEAERCGRVGLMHKGRLLAAAAPEEVKRLMRDSIVEVRAPRARVAAATLKAEFGESSVKPFGDRVHVYAADANAAIERVRNALAKAGVDVSEIREAAPTLEDAFLSVIGASAAEGSA